MAKVAGNVALVMGAASDLGKADAHDCFILDSLIYWGIAPVLTCSRRISLCR